MTEEQIIGEATAGGVPSGPRVGLVRVLGVTLVGVIVGTVYASIFGWLAVQKILPNRR